MQRLAGPHTMLLWAALAGLAGAMLAMFEAHPVKYIYIVDAQGRYQGVVALRDLAAAKREGQPHATAADLLRCGRLPLVTPEMTLGDAYRQFLAHHGERLPVVQSLADPMLLGAVYKTALLDAYARLQPDELPGLRL
jgi:CIC family chloride channel protein